MSRDRVAVLRAPSPVPEAALEGVRAYYESKVATHGATPVAVDWSCRATQELRFAQLLKVCDFGRDFSINDVGCGYGSLAGFLRRRHPARVIDYLGFDVSRGMIDEALRLVAATSCRFEVADRNPRCADYCVASGIFNVRLDQRRPQWRRLVRATLADMQRNCRLGFAVNFIQPARAGAAAPELFTTPARTWTSYCETGLGMRVELVRDYGLPEFTLLAWHRPR